MGWENFYETAENGECFFSLVNAGQFASITFDQFSVIEREIPLPTTQ